MIKCFQLINGQDIMGDVKVDQHGIHIKDPAAIHLVPNQNNTSYGVALMPYIPYADSNQITLRDDKVMVEFEPSVDLRNNYSKMFGAGIQIANVMPGK